MLCAFYCSVHCNDEQKFLSYMRKYGMMFTGDEFKKRLAIFSSNLRYIEEANRANLGYTLGITPFAHLTQSERSSPIFTYKRPQIELYSTSILPEGIPSSLDYRSQGCINPIKTQGICQSCYAFGILAAIESQWALKKHELLVLSESFVLDCCEYTQGCNGGQPEDVIRWASERNYGYLMKESDYPSSPETHECTADFNKGVCNVVGYISVRSGSEEDLLLKVAEHGPACASLDITPMSFHDYKSGIWSSDTCSKTKFNHCIHVIGYGTDAATKTDYWLLRNGWGTDWGENGYMRFRRNYGNMCGLATMAIIPEVE